MRDDYEKMLDLLNETMAEKHKLNININELHNMKKKAEKQIVRQKGAVEEVQKSMSKEATEFEERKRFLEDEVRLSAVRLPDLTSFLDPILRFPSLPFPCKQLQGNP